MNPLPISRRLLTFMGIQVDSPVSRWTTCWFYFMRVLATLIGTCLVFAQIYILLFMDTVLITCTAALGLYVLTLVSYVSVISKVSNLFAILTRTFETLDKVSMKKIKSHERRHASLKAAFMMIIIILGAVYLLQNGIGPETIALISGLRAKPGTDPTIVLIPLTLFIVSVFLYMLCIQFYISVLFVTTQVAEQVRDKLIQANNSLETDYEGIKKSLELFNKLMQTINEEIGMLPFCLLGMEFICFCAGISFLVTSSGDIEVSPYFAAISVGAMNVLYLICVVQIIELSTESQKAIFHAWQMAHECVSDPMAFIPSLESKRMCKSLKFFLITETVVPAKAADTITIDRSLILNFFNQAIPFTVMLFTTMKEMDRKMNNKTSSG